MKRAIRLLILAIIIYAGVKIKYSIEISPYKDAAVSFLSQLKQNKPFEAQEKLSVDLQQAAPIESIKKIAVDSHIGQSKDISWIDWHENEGNYTLDGELLFENDSKMPASFVLFYSEKDEILIRSIRIGETVLDSNSSNFF